MQVSSGATRKKIIFGSIEIKFPSLNGHSQKELDKMYQ